MAMKAMKTMKTMKAKRTKQAMKAMKSMRADEDAEDATGRAHTINLIGTLVTHTNIDMIYVAAPQNMLITPWRQKDPEQ